MNFLEEKIIKDGCVKEGNVLKVDNFLNHQIDISIIRQIAQELKKRFGDAKVDKILTIEASGIAIACFTADLYNVPMVFAKKSETVNATDSKYISKAFSFTHKTENHIFVSKPYLNKGENILIVDDFLAHGEAMNALIDIIHQAGAHVVGLGVAIEKGQQEGGRKLRALGYKVESVAIIESMDSGTNAITFRH